jgi:hypothetical protein
MLIIIIAFFKKKKKYICPLLYSKNVDVWLGSRVHSLVVLEGYGEF